MKSTLPLAIASALALVACGASEPAAADSLATRPAMAVPATTAADRCTPPAFAVAIGHAEKWKLHNNCK